MSPRSSAAGQKNGTGVSLRKHLQNLRVAELRDVFSFWRPDESVQDVKKGELVRRLEETMAHEGTVYRRVRTLTRKVLDVLLLLLRRNGYTSDVPGLFQKLPGEAALKLEYHEAEAGVKALFRRGFIAELSDRAMATNGRVIYAVPGELGGMLTTLFREETRTVSSVFSMQSHLSAITAAERGGLRESFPDLPAAASDDDASLLMGSEGSGPLLDRLDASTQDVVRYAIDVHGGLMLRADWSNRQRLMETRWNREGWTVDLEGACVGTLAQLSLDAYGIQCEDAAVVVFREVLEDDLRRHDPDSPEADEVLRPGGDLVADLCAFIEHVRRHPVKVGRNGEVHKTGRRRIQEGFVWRETFLAGPQEIWAEVHGAAEHLGLVAEDGEGFLEVAPPAEAFMALPLERKAQELYRVAIEQGIAGAKSLHQREIRTLVSECLSEEPERWWRGRSLAAVSRHRYLSSLDERGIKDRHRDRFFSAYFSGRETPKDLLHSTEHAWTVKLHTLGLLDAAVKDDRVLAWRLSPLGARVLGVSQPGLDTGLRPVLVNPDFEVLVLPEGDVSDVVHTLDGYAQRVKSGNVVHFRLTREAVIAAVGAGRSVSDLLEFLEARSRGGVPQNVAYTLTDWGRSVTFATLERGVLLAVQEEAGLDRLLAIPEVEALVLRRLGPTEVLLKEAPADRKLLAQLNERGFHLQGP